MTTTFHSAASIDTILVKLGLLEQADELLASMPVHAFPSNDTVARSRRMLSEASALIERAKAA